MPGYREVAPPPELAASVECFWIGRQDGAVAHSRVLPDGCADILFTRDGRQSRLDVVGPMTRFADYTLAAGRMLVGVRFRPGAWRGHFGVPGDRITDRVLPLEDLWGRRANRLLERLADAQSAEECVRLLSPPPAAPHPLQRAFAWMERSHGSIPVDDLARQCGLSPRQFRRTVLEQAGLGPKFLARVLRFRHAVSRAPAAGRDFARLALDCGYYDQAHLIRDFRQFAGQTPAVYADGRFFQSVMARSPVASNHEQRR